MHFFKSNKDIIKKYFSKKKLKLFLNNSKIRWMSSFC